MRAVPVKLALTNLRLAACIIPSFVSGELPECESSLLVKMYRNCPDFSQKFHKTNTEQARCKILVCNACMLRSILACLKVRAIILTGAEQDVGVGIATNSKP